MREKRTEEASVRQKDKPETPIPCWKRRCFRLLFRRGAIIHHRQWKRYGALSVELENPQPSSSLWVFRFLTLICRLRQRRPVNGTCSVSTVCLNRFKLKLCFLFSGKPPQTRVFPVNR